MKIGMLILAALMLMNLNVSVQKDPAAVKVLDRFSSTALNAPSVSMDFDLVSNDQAESRTDTLSGKVIISGNKYKLELPDNIVWFNGVTSWSYLPAEKEVTLTKPGKQDEVFMSKPSSVFTMYRNGYKIRLVEEKPAEWIIDLYPEDIKSNLIHVRLGINKTTMALNSLEYKQKDGVTRFLKVRKFDLKQKFDPSFFNFQAEQFRDVEVIDMR